MAPEHKILLVEDQRVLRSALQISFERDGYRVLCADTGESALELIQEQHIDLVITDLRLPGIEGIGLVEEIRAQQPWVKAIIMTAYGSQESVVAAMRAGVSDFVEKPFRLEEIRRIVERTMAGRTQVAEAKAATPSGPSPSDPNSALQFLPEPAPQATSAGCVFVEAAPATGSQHFCDAIAINEHTTGIVFGEVPAGNTSGSMLRSLVRAVVYAAIDGSESPASVASKANRALCKGLGQRVPVRLFCAFCDKSQHRIQYVNCGGLPGALFSQDPATFQPIQATARPVGAFPTLFVSTVDTQLQDQGCFLIGGRQTVERIFEQPQVAESFVTAFAGLAGSEHVLTAEHVAPLVVDANETDSTGQSDLSFALLHFKPAELAVGPQEAALTVADRDEDVMQVIAMTEQIAAMAGLDTRQAQQAASAAAEATGAALASSAKSGRPAGAIVKFAASPGELCVEVSSRHWQPLGDGSFAPPESSRLIETLMDVVDFETRPGLGAMVHMVKRGSSDAG